MHKCEWIKKIQYSLTGTFAKSFSNFNPVHKIRATFEKNVHAQVL